MKRNTTGVYTALACTLSPNRKMPTGVTGNTVPMVDIPSMAPDVRRMVRKGQARVVRGVVRQAQSGDPIQRLQEMYISTSGAWDLLEWYEQRWQQSHRHRFGINMFLVALLGAIVIHDDYIVDETMILSEYTDMLLTQGNCEALRALSSLVNDYSSTVQTIKQTIAVDNSSSKYLASHLIRAEAQRESIFLHLPALVYHLNFFFDRKLQLLLSYFTTLMDILPKSAFIEAQGCYHAGSLAMGDKVSRDAYGQYFRVMEGLKLWCSDAGAEHPECALILQDHQLTRLARSQINRLMLTVSV